MTPLLEKTLFGDVDKVADAIAMLRNLEPPEGYYLAFSGGKDSCVIKELANLAGVKYDAHYSVTGIDPPELVRFIKQYHKEVKWEYSKRPFFLDFQSNGLPLRTSPWCCKLLKERAGRGRVVLTGIRALEGPKRANRKQVEHCIKGGNKTFLHVIFHWSFMDVWDFIRGNDIEYCSLYDEGYKRLGCIACPWKPAHLRQQELERWPGFKKAFLRACIKYFNKMKPRGSKSVAPFNSGEELFEWWITRDPFPKDEEPGLYT